MYETFYQFQQRPFAATPQTSFYYQAEEFEHSRQALVRAIDRAEGPALVIGAAGTGKTLLCELIHEQFRESFHTASLACGRLSTRRALLQNILFELGLEYKGMDDGELRLSLAGHLKPQFEGDRGVLLIVDEAHTLPYRLLEELRVLSNHALEGQPRVSLVLAGNAKLEEHFAHPKLASFNQRIAARCYLSSLNREETRGYVRHQLACAAGSQQIFVGDALEAIHTASDGIPRLINQVCDHALLLGSLGGRHEINGRGIEEAWADLQQLPTPWNVDEPTTDAAESGIIEFGSLDDDEPVSEAGEAETPSETPRTDDKVTQLEDVYEAIQREMATELSGQTSSNDDVSMTVSFADYAASSVEDDSIVSEHQVNEHQVSETVDPPAPPEQIAPHPHTTFAPPEAELHAPVPDDLFGSGFDEEEVVIDRFASLESNDVPLEQRVMCAESHEIDELLRQVEIDNLDVGSANTLDIEADPIADVSAPQTPLTVDEIAHIEPADVEPTSANPASEEAESAQPAPQESATGDLLRTESIMIDDVVVNVPIRSAEAHAMTSGESVDMEVDVPPESSERANSANIERPAPPSPIAEPTESAIHRAVTPSFEPETDPVMPVASDRAPGLEGEAVVFGEEAAAEIDDRDMLLIEDTDRTTPSDSAGLEDGVTVRRPEYRRLFAQLRNR